MKKLFFTLLILTLASCSSRPSKKEKVNTEVYSGICFNEKDIEYKTYKNIALKKMSEKGFDFEIDGKIQTLPPYCMFEQGYRLKKSVPLPKAKTLSAYCKMDPFYLKVFYAQDYLVYKVYDDGEFLKLLNPKTRQILLVSTQTCAVVSEKE